MRAYIILCFKRPNIEKMTNGPKLIYISNTITVKLLTGALPTPASMSEPLPPTQKEGTQPADC